MPPTPIMSDTLDLSAAPRSRASARFRPGGYLRLSKEDSNEEDGGARKQSAAKPAFERPVRRKKHRDLPRTRVRNRALRALSLCTPPWAAR